MTLYGLCLLFVVFGLLMAAFDAALLLATPRLLAGIRGMAPERQPGAILAARFAPMGLAAAITISVFLPAWWRHEPANSGEAASLALILLTLLTLLPVGLGFGRALLMLVRTRERILSFERRGRSTSRVSAPFDVVEVPSPDLGLCVGGYLKPTIYASTRVLATLRPAELEAAVAHEVSHGNAHDPLRLLGMGSCPDFLLLFRADEPWRRAFATACEFAADASASRGRPEVALDLASALLKVARLNGGGRFRSDRMRGLAVSSAYSNRADLEARVIALSDPRPGSPAAGFTLHGWMVVLAVLLMGAGGLIASPQVHEVTELIGRLLTP